MSQVTIHHNPFCLKQNVESLPVLYGQSVESFLENSNIKFNQPTICFVNGEVLLRKSWSVTLINANTSVAFVKLPQGGGGGGKILRTVMMLAIMVAAPYAGAAVAGQLGITSAIGSSFLTAGIALSGAVLVNALVPPPMPTAKFKNANAPSPTYSLQAQGNQARLGEPIPVIYGRHVVYPDFGATPYTEFINNDQFLFQLHVIGQGEYDIEQIRIEDTPISSFEEITYEIIPPNGNVTILDSDVVVAPEIAGQELFDTDYTGPFIANPPETQTDKIAIDIIIPTGLYYSNDSGALDNRTITWDIEARTIDDAGVAIGSWIIIASETITAATNTPIRNTYKYTVTAGRYEVRAIRTNTKDTSLRVGNNINWNALRSHLTTIPTPINATMIALKMRATDNLSQRSSRMVNCIITRKLALWDSVNGWSAPQVTQSIAWALADILRSNYGATLSDERIDLSALATLDAIWTARGDTFNAVFDSKMTVWDALSQTARCGRAVPFMQGGVVRFVRDEEKTLPVVLFSPRNIVKNSFSIEYIMPGEDTADSVKVEFFNSNTWKTDEVTAALPDSSALTPATVALFGCTDKWQAMREGLYMAAANRYRRRLVSFKTELEGMIPTYGDLIAISHDMPSWGSTGEITSYTHPVLILSEPVTFEDGQNHYIVLRKRDGSISGPWLVLKGNNDYEIILQDELNFIPYTGESEERTHFSFGIGENWGVLARITSVRPQGELVEISAVAENPLVHSADVT